MIMKLNVQCLSMSIEHETWTDERTIGGPTPHMNIRMNYYWGTYAPYVCTHELVLGDLRPIGKQTKTYMSMYSIVFMSVMFLYYE
jgi:hypothetical protein